MDHVFEGSSCLFCGADDHDIDLPDKCPVEREPMTYTTESLVAETEWPLQNRLNG